MLWTKEQVYLFMKLESNISVHKKSNTFCNNAGFVLTLCSQKETKIVFLNLNELFPK